MWSVRVFSQGLEMVSHLPPSLTSTIDLSTEGPTGMPDLSAVAPTRNDSLGTWKAWNKAGWKISCFDR